MGRAGARDSGWRAAVRARAAVEELRARGAGVIRNLVCIDDEEAQAFWRAQGFERDMVCMSLYHGG